MTKAIDGPVVGPCRIKRILNTGCPKFKQSPYRNTVTSIRRSLSKLGLTRLRTGVEALPIKTEQRINSELVSFRFRTRRKELILMRLRTRVEALSIKTEHRINSELFSFRLRTKRKGINLEDASHENRCPSSQEKMTSHRDASQRSKCLIDKENKGLASTMKLRARK
jgi:hypothetical protein